MTTVGSTLVRLVGFILVLVLVQSRSLASIDQAVLSSITRTRPDGLLNVMNWLFRLGFAQTDLAIAFLWSVWILATRREIGKSLAPLMIVPIVAIEVGLRLVVTQPPPGPLFDVTRFVSGNSIASALDQADASVRTTFEAATAPVASSSRGSFPSGHASRSAFLALWAIWSLRRSNRGIASGETPVGSSSDRWGVRRVRWLVLVAIVACVILPIAISYSAMYFGYHWPSDIAGGILLAFAAIPIAVRIERLQIPPGHPLRRGGYLT